MVARVSILISGRGSNMEALLDAMGGAYPARPALVVADKSDAPGLAKAQKRGVAVKALEYDAYSGRERFEAALRAALKEVHTDIICLAGFMRILSPNFVQAFHGRILNIHPSLLPAYKGLNTHRRAIEAGDSEAGCSVHMVTPALDGGAVLGQKRVAILKHDTEKTLGARVLGAEVQLYPKILRAFIENEYPQTQRQEATRPDHANPLAEAVHER